MLAASAYCQDKTKGTDVKKYNIKSGIIEYEMKGVQTGTQTLYFDDWGKKEATYSEQETKLWE